MSEMPRFEVTSEYSRPEPPPLQTADYPAATSALFRPDSGGLPPVTSRTLSLQEEFERRFQGFAATESQSAPLVAPVEETARPMSAPPVDPPPFRPVLTVAESAPSFADVRLMDDPGIEVSVAAPDPPSWRTWMKEGATIMRDIAVALTVALALGFFVIQPVKVEGTSMLPRLHDGERIFINRFVYQMNPIERGDIVVFYYPKDPDKNFIKRVIGLPGDEITISNGKLRINGKLVPELYLSDEYTTVTSPSHTWVVEPHHYFVMGDNRDASNDSRSWGLVPERYIYGKAMFRYWPLNEAGSLSDDPDEMYPLKSVDAKRANAIVNE
jgi:signal peptidase I